jgi:hypothetical protein
MQIAARFNCKRLRDPRATRQGTREQHVWQRHIQRSEARRQHGGAGCRVGGERHVAVAVANARRHSDGRMTDQNEIHASAAR